MWGSVTQMCPMIILLVLGCELVICQTTSVTLPLPSEAYSEGECITPQVVNIDINWIVSQRTFYVPIASQFSYHRYAETFLSRPATSDTELTNMCLTVEAAQGGGALNLTNIGFDDREFRQTCTPGAEPGRINCFAIGSSAGVNPTKTRATENFVVASDARSYMIIVRCVDGFFRDFSLFSTKHTVSHDVYSTILNVTRNLGFDERRIQTMTYDNCLRSSSGLNNSNFNLHQRTGPFTNNILSAPFPSPRDHNSQPVVRTLNSQGLGQHPPQSHLGYQNPGQVDQFGPQGFSPGHGFPPFLDPNYSPGQFV